MKRWAIHRRWSVYSESNAPTESTTADLIGRRVCCLLGSAGIGKTFELKHLEELEEASGYDTLHVRLGEVASSADRLAAYLDSLARRLTNRSVIYLDALDEAMIPVATTSQILADWIRRELVGARPYLRISCRSAIWPRAVHTAIVHVYGDNSVTVASLEPLTDCDVFTVATSEGVGGDSFLEHVRRSNVGLLARQPLTLRMLLRLFKHRGGLPTGRRELFSQAVTLLVSEREERRDLGTVSEIEPGVLLEAAERLACFMVFSGCETVDLSDDPAASSLGWLELANLPSSGPPLDDRLLRAVGRSGLCEGDGANRFRFIHRQMAEYLAGRRAAKLLLHQSRAVLNSGMGWHAGVAGPLRETAAFAAIENHDLARWVSETDPEVVGLSDVADDCLRRRATLEFLERFRRHELTDTLLVRDELPLAGLKYPDAAHDLRPVLRERGEGCEDVLELAIELVKSWQLSSLHGDLADLILDPNAPLQPRVSAAYVLEKCGTREVKRRMRPLIAGSPGDPDEELKGMALRCCWPEDLGTGELLPALRPWGDRSLHGAYFGFLLILERAGFAAADDRVRGLAWAKSVLEAGRSSDPTVRIAQHIAHGAVREIDDPAVAEALAELLWESARQRADSPLEPIPQYSRAIDSPVSPAPLVGNLKARQVLLKRLVAKADDGHNLWWVAHQTPGLLVPEDFAWLLENACNTEVPEPERERYAGLASAASSLRIGVADFSARRETSDQKEVSHEQEVRRSPVGFGA